ncbi:MAG: hypothetical protein BWY31_00015 [Lentisphaerae bacterium ADurb.Bin242]|nr:MAG: hypothetical protein BWY31_00015 [Lentisphaerae bacterium ADurb.Bin242]
MTEPKSDKKRIRKIVFLILGTTLSLFLAYDLLELLFLYTPGHIRVYSYTKMNLTEPFTALVKVAPSEVEDSVSAESASYAILADNLSPLPLRRGDSKVYYSVWTAEKSGRVFILHKFLTFFWGFMGPVRFEITDPTDRKKLSDAAKNQREQGEAGSTEPSRNEP